jgi:hypothetical protein
MSPAEVRNKLSEKLTSAPLPPTATDTEQRPAEEIRAEIRRVVETAENLPDDLLIAVQVRKREVEDSGERVLLEDFMREQGYDPADFGLE